MFVQCFSCYTTAMTELRRPFRTIPIDAYHQLRADLPNRVFEDELENDLVAEAYALTPASVENGQAVNFDVYIDNLERHRIHDKGRAGFRLVVFGTNTAGLSEAGFDSFAISHIEDPARERSPMAWEIVGRPLQLKNAGAVRYGFLRHAVRDDSLKAFTSRSWQIPDDLSSNHH